MVVPDRADGSNNLAARFFSAVSTLFPLACPIRLVVVTHLLRDRPVFLSAVSQACQIEALVPIPYSTNGEVLEALRGQYQMHEFTLDEMLNGDCLRRLMNGLVGHDSTPMGILEIGGYFAPLANDLKRSHGSKFLGVVEDTENGHRRYEQHSPLLCPVVSVARSFLKLVEDRLIGPSVAFSLERFARAMGRIFNTLTIGILGYGKIGSSVARALGGRGAHVAVYDILQRRRALALADGFLSPSREQVLQHADFLVGATGTESVSRADLSLLKDGVVLASSSSKRVEFDIAGLRANAIEAAGGPPGVERFRFASGKVAYLLANGEPINFVDDAVVGPANPLVQAEQLVALSVLTNSARDCGILSVPETMQDRLAETWLRHFVDIDGMGAFVQSGTF